MSGASEAPIHPATAAMVLFKIAIVAAAIAGLMVAAQNQRWFQRAGLLSTCQVTQAPYGTRLPGQWWSCKEGAVSGFPNLARDNCDSRGVIGHTQLWYCAIPIADPS